jgi:hypothetical protein
MQQGFLLAATTDDQNIHEPNAVERHKLSIAKHQNAAMPRHKAKPPRGQMESASAAALFWSTACSGGPFQ